MSRRVPGRLAVLAVALTFLLPTARPATAADLATTPNSAWTGVERVVAFADVHGAYTEIVALLQAAGVVDARLRWSAGKAHVVSTGDLLDRGADSRKVMDLLMRLQDEAARAGGRLHVVLGNHEAMNVLGDLRYVIPGEFAAYAADEDPAERTRQREALRARQPGLTDAEFDRRFPPGYFGHRRLLGPGGRYGRWLLGLPVAIRVNDTVYMHGGPSSLLRERSIEHLNAGYGAALAAYAAAAAALTKAGLINFEDAYSRRSDLARARLDSLPPGEEQARLAPLVERFRSASQDPLLGPTGPNWYRGAALCNECAEADVLEPFLAQVGARRVVVGHTTARNGTVVTRFDGAVVKLDAGLNHAVYGGRPAALVSDAAGSRVVYASPATASAPPTPAEVPAEPLYLSSKDIGEDAVADLLARGSIDVTETCARGVLAVRVSHGESSVEAVFEAADRRTVQRELTAWRLDRLLGLGLVPATVARNHAGQDGVLQGRPVHWASEQDRINARNGTRAGLACQAISNGSRAAARRAPPADGSAPKLPAGGYCDLDAQYQLAYAFDALIGNRARGPDRFLYDADATTLFLSGHGAAFDGSTDVAKALEAPLARTGPELKDRLRRLEAAPLQAALGEFVSPREIGALLKRRDRILELAR
ncbi:MAG: metallophosphoesterase [Gammaproteobacteria bacterium]